MTEFKESQQIACLLFSPVAANFCFRLILCLRSTATDSRKTLSWILWRFFIKPSVTWYHSRKPSDTAKEMQPKPRGTPKQNFQPLKNGSDSACSDYKRGTDVLHTGRHLGLHPSHEEKQYSIIYSFTVFFTRDICSSRTSRDSRCWIGAVQGPGVGPRCVPPAFFSSPLRWHSGASQIHIDKKHCR